MLLSHSQYLPRVSCNVKICDEKNDTLKQLKTMHVLRKKTLFLSNTWHGHGQNLKVATRN